MSVPLDGANGLDDQQTNYPFLVQHIPNDTPDKGDPTSSSRQKRRRTSPQDHATLEAAYQRNSKPDKNERIEIVRHVELGEKEVQIWFQNRRQTDRRKSRPLLPHELVPHFRNGVPIEILQHSPQTGSFQHELQADPVPTPSPDQDHNEELVHSRASSIHELLNPSSSLESKNSTSKSSVEECLSSNASPLSSFEQSNDHGHRCSIDMASSTRPEQDERTLSGRKRAYAEMTGPAIVSERIPAQRPTKLPSQGSMVRLSMTADGAVKVRTSDQETPSPPRESAPAPDMTSRKRDSLRRTNSALEASNTRAQSDPLFANPKVADGKLGRSRDARTWEFYCDSEARDSLSSYAEQERNGSAVGAINMIRSQSQRQLRQMLAPVPARSNARTSARIGYTGQRSQPKLARAKSSLARLQGAAANLGKDNKSSRLEIARSPSGDSDKENWAPGTHASQNPLRRTNDSSSGRPVLASNDSMLSYASGLESQAKRNVRRITGKENSDAISVGLKEKGSDLDCVQGLLSLSQGAWR